MPKSPVLPVLDWKAVFDSGMDYAAWLDQNETPENCAEMRAMAESISIPVGLAESVATLERRVYIVAIAEDWCGDVVRHVPLLAKLIEASTSAQMRFITREQHPDVFIRFLTNGGEAIPKFIFLNEQFVETGNWGPMPDLCRNLIARGKGANDVGAARTQVSAIYEAGIDRVWAAKEMSALILRAACLVV